MFSTRGRFPISNSAWVSEAGRKRNRQRIRPGLNPEEGTTMKSFVTNLMLAAATLTVASTVASGQTMKAEIPFAFRAGKTTMAPGNYEITLPSVDRCFHLFRTESREGILLMHKGAFTAP